MIYCEKVGDSMGKKNGSKVICSCHKITKREMKEAILHGRMTFKEFRKETKLGSKCSSCKSKNKERYKKYIRKLDS